jgi:hypothetical protein
LTLLCLANQDDAGTELVDDGTDIQAERLVAACKRAIDDEPVLLGWYSTLATGRSAPVPLDESWLIGVDWSASAPRRSPQQGRVYRHAATLDYAHGLFLTAGSNV